MCFATLDLLGKHFEAMVILCRLDVNWPPKSTLKTNVIHIHKSHGKFNIWDAFHSEKPLQTFERCLIPHVMSKDISTNKKFGDVLDYEAWGHGSGQTIKYFFGDSFSADFWQKTLRVNKFVMKSISKNLSFGIDFKYRFHHSCIKYTRSGVWN